MGGLFLDFKGHENFKNYNRTLDIEKAISMVSYEVNGVTFKREIFSSFANNVIMIKLSSSKKGSLNFSVNASTPHKINSIFTEKNNWSLLERAVLSTIKPEKLILKLLLCLS